MAATLCISFLITCLLIGQGFEMGEAAQVSRLFVFGDSFADTGNDQNLNMPYSSLRYPYGESYPSIPTGRWSDGKIQTDFIAEYLNLPSPISYTKRLLNVPLQVYGMNFAYGGTGVFDTFTGLPSMTEQIDSFEQVINSGLYFTGLDTSVAFVSYAGNDYRVYAERHNGSLEGIDPLRVQVTKQLAANVQRLNSLGVKKIAVSFLQPVGCGPTVTASNNFQQCVSLYNDAATRHNQLLKDAIAATQVPVVFLDNYNAFLSVLPTAPFGNQLKACCLGKSMNIWCGTVGNDGSPQYTLCQDPYATFWWDNNHPTQAAWFDIVQFHRPSLDQLLQ